MAVGVRLQQWHHERDASLFNFGVNELFGSYEEKANLHLIATAPSGTGKTPACQKECVEPIVSQLWAMLRRKFRPAS